MWIKIFCLLIKPAFANSVSCTKTQLFLSGAPKCWNSTVLLNTSAKYNVFIKRSSQNVTIVDLFFNFFLWTVEANGDPSYWSVPRQRQRMTTPSFAQKVEVAVQSLKKGKSAWVDNIPAELVWIDGEDVIIALTTICQKIWQTGEWPTPWTQSLVITLPKNRQPAAVPELPNDQPHQSPKQSHAQDHTGQTDAINGEDHCWRTGRLQSRTEHHQSRYSINESSVRNISSTSKTYTMSS